MSMHRQHLLDSLFVGVLILYIVAGIQAVPFHGDESTIIFMSRDWYTIAHQFDPAALAYNPQLKGSINGVDVASLQELRILNGTLTSYGIGFMWSIFGFSVNDINDQWPWGTPAEQVMRTDSIHMPRPTLLAAARLWSGLVTSLSVAVLFALSWRLLPRIGAYAATFLYATTPAVLLNGRRAVFEPVFIFMLLMLTWAAIRVVVNLERQFLVASPWRRWIVLGIVGGLALTAKHTALLVIALILSLLIGITLWRLFRNRRLVPFLPSLGKLVGAIILTVALMSSIFFALNPSWWRDPYGVAMTVLDKRSKMLEDQAKAFGQLQQGQQRLAQLVYLPLGPAQYYEVLLPVQNWAGALQAAIQGYEHTWFGPLPLAGIAWDWLGWTLAVLGCLSMITMFLKKKSWLHSFFVILSATVIVAIFFVNPLPWQRYYLPCVPFLTILGGAGTAAIVNLITILIRKKHTVR